MKDLQIFGLIAFIALVAPVAGSIASEEEWKHSNPGVFDRITSAFTSLKERFLPTYVSPPDLPYKPLPINPETVVYYLIDKDGNLEIGRHMDKNNPCPVTASGTQAGYSIGPAVPHLKDPGYYSGGLCRGACGIDCPSGRCIQKPDIEIEVKGGTCTYRNVIECKTHEGCREHDACYDWCAERGEPGIIGPCHRQCDLRCSDLVGTSSFDCLKWAGLTCFDDSMTSVQYDGVMLFSDPPVYTEEKVQEVRPVPAQSDTYDCDCRLPPMHSAVDIEAWRQRCGCY